MKGLKPTFISILVVGLFAGSAVGVAAQHEAAEIRSSSRPKWAGGLLSAMRRPRPSRVARSRAVVHGDRAC